MLSGSVGIPLGQLPCLLPHLLAKGLVSSSRLGRVQSCRIHVPMLSWVGRMLGICSVAYLSGHTRLVFNVVPMCPYCEVCCAQGFWYLGGPWTFCCSQM